MLTDADLLAIYDRDLREELASASRVERHGPLIWGQYSGGQGMVTYASLGDAGTDAARVEALVADTVEHFASWPEVTKVEWKTRGHDVAVGLVEALTRHGFTPEETESVMLGEAADLVTAPPAPAGVTIAQVTEESDVRRLGYQSEVVFGDPHDGRYAEALLNRLALGRNDMELWVAEADGEIVSAGRLEFEGDSPVAGIWGGGTLPDWRGRGIYRALTAERARSALSRGRTLIHSDSTEFSRPILERSGFRRVSTTTPYYWQP